MNFKELCTVFEQVKVTSKLPEKSKVLQEFFAKCRENVSKERIFSILRLLLSNYDRERESYNMKESKIGRVIIKMLGLPPGNDKNVLSKSYLSSGAQATDFSQIVYSVIRKYLSYSKTTLTIEELNKYLDAIVKRSSETEAEEILLKVFKKCSAEDSRWIIQIILKDLKLGLSNHHILKAYHKDADEYHCINANLRKVIENLYDIRANINELNIEVFESFGAMLSKRVDANVFRKNFMENTTYFLENKFDGERFQLHMQNGNFKFFSRNNFDFTKTFGENYDDEDGIYTCKLKDLFQPVVNKIILDGEMMLWHKKEKKYGSKGMQWDVKKLKEDGTYQPCFCIYDILLYNDKILANKPLKERIALLKRILKNEIPGTIVLSEIKEVNSRQEIIDELNKAVDNEDEGIIVKNPDSVYKCKDRNGGWFKMKLEYFEDAMNDLDLMLMGGIFGSLSQQLNSFIVGVQSGYTEMGQPIFISFAKVSSGLNSEQLEMVNKKLKNEGTKYESSSSQTNRLLFGKETPNYYIEPEKSLIFVVRATELIRNTDDSFKTSYVLRFPRILKIRDDKPVDECLKMNELLELTNKNQAVLKLNKRNITLKEILETKSRKQSRKRKIEVIKFEDTRQKCDILEDLVFYILNAAIGKSKDEIEARIKQAGGKISYRTDESVDVALIGAYDENARKFCSKRYRFDIIDVQWLYRITQAGEVLPYETAEIYSVGNNIKSCLNDHVDRYGDNYTKDATIDSLKKSFEIMKNLKEEPIFRPLIKFPLKKNFQNYTAYFDKYSAINNMDSEIIYRSLEDELEFRYYFGKVSKTISASTNLIITNCAEERLKYLEEFLGENNRDDILIKEVKFIYN